MFYLRLTSSRAMAMLCRADNAAVQHEYKCAVLISVLCDTESI